MSDEPERAENAASEDTPAPSPAEPEAKQPPAEPTADKALADDVPGEPADEAAAPAAEEPSPQEPASESAEEPSDGAAPAQAADEEPSEEPEPPAEEKPSESPAPTPAANYDGLDSGLAWLGPERFDPPAPVGYEPLPQEAAKPAKELSTEERRRIHGRAAARRQEVETQKKWYQKIPIGALSMVPILVILLVVALVYPPWAGRAFPDSKEPLDEALLSATPLANSDQALRALGVQDASPKCWRVLPGDILMMTAAEATAKLSFTIPRGLPRLEVACDLCVLERDANAWGVSIGIEGAVGITLQAHPSKPGEDYVAGRRAGASLAGYAHAIKLKMWNRVTMTVDEAGTRYTFNGKALKATAPRPGRLNKVDLTTYNTRLLIRNWRIQEPQ
ncbi:MAG TPA: hypothetical protein VNE39_15665 [Planctomycetota bacterium]|nr:hypothetical protein [Planctomycetota bacterium]